MFYISIVWKILNYMRLGMGKKLFWRISLQSIKKSKYHGHHGEWIDGHVWKYKNLTTEDYEKIADRVNKRKCRYLLK